MKSKIKPLILIGIALVGVLISLSCAISIIKLDNIEKIDRQVLKLKASNLEYSTILIEDEAEKVKAKIKSLFGAKKIINATKEGINSLNNLVLTDEETLNIKQIYYNHLQDESHELQEKSPNDIKILYYLGNFNGKHVAMIDGDKGDVLPTIDSPIFRAAFPSDCTKDTSPYVFMYRYVFCSVYANGKYEVIGEDITKYSNKEDDSSNKLESMEYLKVDTLLENELKIVYDRYYVIFSHLIKNEIYL